uniref:ribonucleoside-diphosphate reductase n=1 Tax=viral metagenome TaxID=1070528 RepID=A0A6C0I5G0_9ZZZZ
MQTNIEPCDLSDNNKMNSNSQMYVIKRNGNKQELLFDNITRRNLKLAKDLNIDTTSLSLSVIQGLKSGMTTREIDYLSCENAIYKSTYEPNYAILAARIAVNDLHKTTPGTFRECIDKLFNNVNKINNQANPLIDNKVYEFAIQHMDIIEKSIAHDNDYNYTYFGFKTLEKSYLQKVNGVIVERPQYMLMRVALGIHGPCERNGFLHKGDIELTLQTYKELSAMKFTHATPTLFYSGTPRPQMSSCFLLNCPDSINGITDCWKTCSFISKHAGGIGVDLTVRSKGSYISGTNGNSNGIIPLIKVFNEIARYVDQCFVPGTEIVASTGLVHIDKLVPGNKVLCSNSTYQNVNMLVQHKYKGKIYEVKLIGRELVRVTPEHQMLSLFVDGFNNGISLYDMLEHKLDKGLLELEFHDMKELKVGDMIAFPCNDDYMKGEYVFDMIYKDYGLIEIEEINEVDYEGPVYDLEIDTPHDYTVSNLGIAHNGGGKRKGAISLYLQPWHPDISEFLEIRFNTGPEEARARDIFPALWIPDLFFKRLQQPNAKWSLFCPGKYPELITLYGDEFEKRYTELETQKCYEKQIPLEDLWKKILKSLEETGLPYMMSKDNVNNKSNHKNIGPITGSNLCTEIVQYHDAKSTAVCNLASICLPQYVKEDGRFDFEELGRIVEIVVHNMNNIIDKNYYPEYEIDCFDDDEYDGQTKPKKVIGRNNNLKYRPIGIGIQGLADVFAKMKLPWESQDARVLNQVIFETIYYHALKKSYNISRFDYGPYSKFQGSPVSQGILQYDMWNITPYTQTHSLNTTINIPKFNWNMLKSEIKQYGIRNSLMIAPMPTASTSQIMGNTEAFEPLTSNLYIRKVGAGDFPIVNNHLYRDLKELGMWKKEIIDDIIMNNGSIQKINEIPDTIKKLYKTVWELPQKIIVDFAADRGAFIDQTQSLNIFMERPTVSKLSSLYMYGWKRGLKTLSYYLRTQPAVGAVKFTVMNENINKVEKEQKEQNEDTVYKINKYTGQKFICTEDVCTACSS